MNYKNYILENSEDWLKYTFLLNVMHEDKASLVKLKESAMQDNKIKCYLYDVSNFHQTVVNTHKNPELPIHKLTFLLELGFERDISEINTAIEAILAHKDEYGVYQSLTNIPKHYGGSGENTFSWFLCDAPLLLYALVRANVDYESHIKQGVEYLLQRLETNGFPCAVSQELGKFRGPGKKSDCCPYATLLMLKLLNSIPEYKTSEVVTSTANALLDLWETSLEKHPYMFYMGTDFRKIKAPLIWYDIVSVLDILSQIQSIQTDKRYLEMIHILQNKQDENGLYIAESIYQKCKSWDFGQKKIPSMYVTYKCHQILDRVNNH